MFEIRKDSFYLDGKPFRVFFGSNALFQSFARVLGRQTQKAQSVGYELRGNGNLLEFARAGRR